MTAHNGGTVGVCRRHNGGDRPLTQGWRRQSVRPEQVLALPFTGSAGSRALSHGRAFPAEPPGLLQTGSSTAALQLRRPQLHSAWRVDSGFWKRRNALLWPVSHLLDAHPHGNQGPRRRQAPAVWEGRCGGKGAATHLTLELAPHSANGQLFNKPPIHSVHSSSLTLSCSASGSPRPSQQFVL